MCETISVCAIKRRVRAPAFTRRSPGIHVPEPRHSCRAGLVRLTSGAGLCAAILIAKGAKCGGHPSPGVLNQDEPRRVRTDQEPVRCALSAFPGEGWVEDHWNTLWACEDRCMISHQTCLAMLDTVHHAIVFVDNGHIIKYLNKAAEKRYYEQRGYSDLIGHSLLDYHNPGSQTQIKEVYRRLQAGEDQVSLGINRYNELTTVVAVRDKDRNLLGYYERFEKVPAASAAEAGGPSNAQGMDTAQ